MKAKNPNCFACGSDQIGMREQKGVDAVGLLTFCKECGNWDFNEPLEGLNHTRMTGKLIKEE